MEIDQARYCGGDEVEITGSFKKGLGSEMTNYEYFQLVSKDELADWLDKHGAFDDSPWNKWFDKIYCKNCPDISCKSPIGVSGFACSWCELHGNCKFFPDLEEIPNNKQVIKIWLEQNKESEN